MAKIPELMSGRALEHDLKFASDGPMSGLVHGVQELSAGGSTLTLKLSETSETGEAQLKSDIVSIDGEGASVTVKLPAALTNGPDLKGRVLRIHNAGSVGEMLIIQESDASHICTVGFGDYADIMFLAQGTPLELKKLKKHSIEIAHAAILTLADTGVEILPAIASVGYRIDSAKFVFALNDATAYTNTGNIDLLSGTTGSVQLETLGSLLTAAGSVGEQAIGNGKIDIGESIEVKDDSGNPGSGEAGNTLTVTAYYYEI